MKDDLSLGGTGLAGPGARAFVVGGGGFGKASDGVGAAVERTVAALGDALVGRCGLPAANLRMITSAGTPAEVGLALADAAEEAEETLVVLLVGCVLPGAGGEAYFATAATDTRPNRLPLTAVPLSGVLATVGSSLAPARAVVIDSYRPGPEELSGGGGSADVVLRPVEGVDVVLAGVAGASRFAAVGEFTPLSAELLRLLVNGDPGAPAELTFDYLLGQAGRTLHGRGQERLLRHPSRWADRLVLARNPAHTPPIVEVDAPPTRKLADLPAPVAGIDVPTAPAPEPAPGAPPEPRAGEDPGREEPAPPGAADGAQVCPYPGLAAFDAAWARWFFGRESATADLLGRVEAHLAGAGPLVLIGASGSGKSSLLRAGLLPALARGALPGSASWPQVQLTPTDHPVRRLAEGLAAAGGLPVLAAAHLESVVTDRGRFADVLSELLAQRADGNAAASRRVVIAVDQFEEAFTLCADERERLAFIRTLCTVATGAGGHPPPAVVVLAVRADFYGPCAAYPELVEVLQAGQVVVGPMTGAEVREAIVNPARAVGQSLEPGLVELLLHDLGADERGGGAVADPGSLPLLAHALRATWHEREGEALTVAGYLRVGGLHGAVALTAERTYGALDAAGQATARLLLVRMVHIGESADDTRRRVRREVLLGEVDDPHASAVLDALVQARLVEVDADSVQIAHEALLRSWPRLREWIDIDRAGALTRQQVAEASEVWERNQRDPSYLFAGTRLDTVREWIDVGDHLGELSPSGRAFLEASTAREDAERRARQRRTRRLQQGIAVLAVLVLLATGAMVFAFQQRSSAAEARDRALSQRIATDATVLRAAGPTVAAQLGLVAYRLAPTPEARGAVLSTFGHGYGPATRYLAHSGSVGATAYSPDGRLVATGSDDWSAKLWDVADPRRREPVGVLTGHELPVKAVAFRPDGRLLATGGEDRSVKLWDIADPARPVLRSTLPPASAPVFGLSFAPDGRTLAAGGYGSTVTLWDVSNAAAAKPLGTIAGHTDLVRAVAFSPDGQHLATGSEDTTAKLWDVTDPTAPTAVGDLAPDPGGDPGQVRSLAFSGDGKAIVTGDVSGAARVFRIDGPTQPELVTTIGAPDVQVVAFSPDNQTVAVATQYDIRLYNPFKYDNLITRYSQGFKSWSASFSPDGRTIAVGANDGGLRIWDVTGPLLVGHSDTLSGAAMRPQGRVLATGSYDTTVRLWDLSDPYRPETLAELEGHTNTVDEMEFTPDGRVLATADWDGTLKLWDVSDVRNPVLQSTVASGIGSVWSIAFDPAGRILVVGGEKGRTRLWDTADITRPRPLATFSARPTEASVAVVAFSPDGRTVATAASANFERLVRLWDVADPRRPKQVGAVTGFETGGIFALDFAPDGRTLAAGGGDRTVTLWDVGDLAAPRLVATLSGNVGSVDSIDFSPDGRRVAAGGGDWSVRVWDITDIDRPASFARIEGNSDYARVLFTPDGKILVGAPRADVSGYVWELDTEGITNRICAKVGDPLTRDEWGQYVPELPYDPPCS